MFSEKPIVIFRKKLLKAVKPITINKESYLKQGSKVTQTRIEEKLFDNVFEFELNKPYEDHYISRKLEQAVKQATLIR